MEYEEPEIIYRDLWIDIAMFLICLAEIGCGATKAVAIARRRGYALSERVVRKFYGLLYDMGLIVNNKGSICSTPALIDLMAQCGWQPECVGRMLKTVDSVRQASNKRLNPG